MSEDNSGLFSMISGFVDNTDQAWKHLVCPYKHKYALESLGPHIQCWNGTTYRRQDDHFRNSLGNQIEYTLFFNDEKTPENDFFLIYLHTHGGCRLEGYHMLRHCGKHGFGLCILDFGGSGHSEGEFISLGHFEQHDLVQLTGILHERHSITNYAVWGRSMGASTAMLAYPVIAPFVLVLDSPFTSVNRVYRCAVKKHISLPDLMIDMVYNYAAKEVKKRFNFDIDAITPFENGSQIKVPTVLIGTPEDQITEYSELLELYEIIQLPGIQKVIVQCQGSHTDDRDERTLDSSMQFIVDVFRSIKLRQLPKRGRGVLQSNSFSNIHSMKNQMNFPHHPQGETRPQNAIPNNSGNQFYHHHTIDNSRFVGGNEPPEKERRDNEGIEWIVNQEQKTQPEPMFTRRPPDLSIGQNISVAKRPIDTMAAENQTHPQKKDSVQFQEPQMRPGENNDSSNHFEAQAEAVQKGEIASRINLKKNLSGFRRPEKNLRGRKEAPSANRDHHSLARHFGPVSTFEDEYTPGGRSRLKISPTQVNHFPSNLQDRDQNHPAKERATSLKRNNFVTQNRIGFSNLASKIAHPDLSLEQNFLTRNGSILKEDQLPRPAIMHEPVYQENTPVQQHNPPPFVQNVSEFSFQLPSKNSDNREIFQENVFAKQVPQEKLLDESPRIRHIGPNYYSSNMPFQVKSTNYRPLLALSKKEAVNSSEQQTRVNESLSYNRSYQNYAGDPKYSPKEDPRSMLNNTHRGMPYYVQNQGPTQTFNHQQLPLAQNNASFQEANHSFRLQPEKYLDTSLGYNHAGQSFKGPPANQPHAQRRADLKQRGNFIDFNRHK
jgi:hypothetical protein